MLIPAATSTAFGSWFLNAKPHIALWRFWSQSDKAGGKDNGTDLGLTYARPSNKSLCHMLSNDNDTQSWRTKRSKQFVHESSPKRRHIPDGVS